MNNNDQNSNQGGGVHVHVNSPGNNIAQQMTITINGNVYNGQAQEIQCQYTDEQVAQALLAITGKDKVLNNYQLWLGACCLLMARCDFPRDLERCCDCIAQLPYGSETLPIECKYENIRKFSYLRFVREDVDTWREYQPKEDEKKLFYGCKTVAEELDKKLKQKY